MAATYRIESASIIAEPSGDTTICARAVLVEADSPLYPAHTSLVDHWHSLRDYSAEQAVEMARPLLGTTVAFERGQPVGQWLAYPTSPVAGFQDTRYPVTP